MTERCGMKGHPVRGRAKGVGWLPALVVAGAMTASPLLAQERGTVTGIVVDASNERPLQGVQVIVPGSGLGTLTSEAGRYVLSVPTGEQTVETQIIGYRRAITTVSVQPGESVVADFRLEQTAVSLNEIVVTGTGAPTERRRLGQTINTVTNEELALAPITSVTQALQGRVVGLGAGAGFGTTGEADRIYLRGTASVTQRNEPLVYVDGIRIDNTRTEVSGVQSDRLSTINPADIARIEVIRGAAAATLFGTEASSGVIQIFTKRGASGEPVYTFQIDQQIIQMDTDKFPTNAGYDPATKQIVRDRPSDVWVDLGHHQNYMLSIRGGTTNARYYLSGRLMDEVNPLPNNNQRIASVRANLNFNHTDRLRSSVNVSATRSSLEAPNPTWGSIVSEFLLANPAVASETRPHGELDFTVPGSLKDRHKQQGTNLLLGATVDYDVTEGVHAQFKAGYNPVTVRRTRMRPEGVVLDLPGVRQVWNDRMSATTLDARVSWDIALTDRIQSSLVIGGQSFREKRISETTEVENFAAPSLRTLRGGSTITDVDESQEEVINAGVFLQEQVALDDLLFVTGGIRMDGNSAFGEDFGFEYYPKFGLSWVISDHDFWNLTAVDALRLRGAVGSSGLQPGAFDALRTWTPTIHAGAYPAVEPQNLGNPRLKPERSTEREVGIEAGLFSGLLGLNLVYHNSTTTDALVDVSPAPSAGFTSSQLQNIGEISSQGVELMANVRVVDRPAFRWDFNVGYTWIKQVVEDLGGAAPWRIQGRRRWSWIREGFRPGAVIAPIQDPADPYRVAAPIAEVRTLEEIQPNLLKAADGTDSLAFMGNSLPSWTVDVGSTIAIGENLSIRTLFSGAGGFIVSNENSVLRSALQINELTATAQKVLDDPSSSIEERERVIDAYGRKHASVVSSHMEDGNYLRWNELMVTYRIPWFGNGNTTLSLGARNLMLFTGYSGLVDPGTGGAPGGGNAFLQNIDYLSAPSTRRFVLSLRTTL